MHQLFFENEMLYKIFEIDKKNLMLKFRGSENQRIILVQQSLKSDKTVLSELNT